MSGRCGPAARRRHPPARREVCAALLWVGALAGAPVVRSQDFTPALAAGVQSGSAALLERALPAPDERWAFEAAATRWFALPDLETRSLSLLVPVRTLRLAAGLSQTGDGELGWTCAGACAGAATPEFGFALRIVSRRDRAGGGLLTSDAALGAGFEAGGGAWIAPATGARLWASAPQLWTRGEAPPLARPLELGASLARGALAGWIAIDAASAEADGAQSAGVSLAAGALDVWAEARSSPTRASVGLAGTRGRLRFAARIEGHPVLGETATVSLTVRRSAGRESP